PSLLRSRFLPLLQSADQEAPDQNGAPPAGPRGPHRLLRRAAATGAAAANAQRAACRQPASCSQRASGRQPASSSHRTPGRQPASSSQRSSGTHHASSGATGPGHAPSGAAGSCHPSSGSHHPAGHPSTCSHHPASGSSDAASARTHHPAAVAPGHPASSARHPAAITAHVATTRHTSSDGDPAVDDAHDFPDRRTDDIAHRDAVDVSDQPQDDLPDKLTDFVSHSGARRHAGDGQQRLQRARGRRRGAGGLGERGPRRLPLSSRAVHAVSSFPRVAAAFFFFRGVI
ncbi:SKI family transcriptional corepressor 2, partial [Triticum aestivum]|uniref:SKI family transcriptional corepressor 2 n=1 Tax=Triticum aestivum TaxID=4565 RepID=UPI001D0033A0